MANASEWLRVVNHKIEKAFFLLERNKAGALCVSWGYLDDLLIRKRCVTYDKEVAASMYYLTISNQAASEALGTEFSFEVRPDMLRGNELGIS